MIDVTYIILLCIGTTHVVRNSEMLLHNLTLTLYTPTARVVDKRLGRKRLFRMRILYYIRSTRRRSIDDTPHTSPSQHCAKGVPGYTRLLGIYNIITTSEMSTVHHIITRA